MKNFFDFFNNKKDNDTDDLYASPEKIYDDLLESVDPDFFALEYANELKNPYKPGS